MATTSTLTEEVPVEVTSNTGSEESSLKKSSGFNKLRQRFKKDNDTKRPSDAKWRQQQIPACRPVFSAKHVCFGFSVIGLVFLALGIAFTVILSRLHEYEMGYTLCTPTTQIIVDANFTSCDQYIRCKYSCEVDSDDQACGAFLNASNVSTRADCMALPLCQCQINITTTEQLEPTVHMYYGIQNFYQNHRRYLNSLDSQQIQGNIYREPTADCLPLIFEGNTTIPILPCGLIANSWFNDSILSIRDTTPDTPEYQINRNNIAWATDRNTRFNSTAPLNDARNVSKPPNWPVGIFDIPDGLNNESLIVWFRVSAFPWFRKLYGRIMVNDSAVPLPASTYTVDIIYSYPVTDFNGGKSVILAEVSWLGGRNLFLGAAYIIVGVLLLISGLVLLIIHLTCSKWKETDKNFLRRSY